YFGTGDRAHPRYAMIKNRFYVVADYGYSSDSDQETDERHLFNLTCDELDDHVDANSDGLVNADDGDYRNDIKDIIKNRHPGQLPDHECRGWFRALEGQANCASPISSHVGEKVLSRPFLFHRNVFSTTYQPVFGDPCNPGGTGRIYAIDYSWGTHVFNFYLDNDIIDE
ncbi:MAG: hypothetical protein GY849_22195, partial [Deltaproteobacteria bacterium]|nr:hypothetical protein [Deltaproteobacteria bacterium]